MFEKYNINDLFIANINVLYPKSKIGITNIGDVLTDEETGYSYVTILRKKDNNYIDLQDNSTITKTNDPNNIRRTIDYIKPLSKYYIKDDKNIFSKEEAIRLSLEYYQKFHQDEERTKSKSL